MANAKKAVQSKRAEMIAVIAANPGITSGEIGERVGIHSASKVTTALWSAVRSGRVMTERVERAGRFTNAHYMADQVPPDAVERINQKLVDASTVIPISKAAGARSSVFDVPGKPVPAAKSRHRKRVVRSVPKAIQPASAATQVTADGFACAVASNGQLVLMREGQIQFALTDVEVATLQSYLMKRAAGSLFASMA